VDILRFLNVLEPRANRRWTRAETLIVDLTLAEEAVLSQMSKRTRYEVRRAASKDGLVAETFGRPEPEVLERFTRYYDEFAQSKGLSPLARPRLDALAGRGMLVLTLVSSEEDGSPLAWHAYAGAARRAMLLYSASLFREQDDSEARNRMGRANRYLHWSDMLSFKAAGYVEYDLGGIDVAGRDPATTRIADFKRGFGGELRPTHTASAGVSAKGRLALAALRLRRIDF
jgi:hypothetical protein